MGFHFLFFRSIYIGPNCLIRNIIEPIINSTTATFGELVFKTFIFFSLQNILSILSIPIPTLEMTFNRFAFFKVFLSYFSTPAIIPSYLLRSNFLKLFTFFKRSNEIFFFLIIFLN